MGEQEDGEIEDAEKEKLLDEIFFLRMELARLCYRSIITGVITVSVLSFVLGMLITQKAER